MSYRFLLLGACAALALAGCVSNEEIAARRCSTVAGPADARDQCIGQELARLAKEQEPPISKDSGSGGGGGGW